MLTFYYSYRCRPLQGMQPIFLFLSILSHCVWSLGEKLLLEWNRGMEKEKALHYDIFKRRRNVQRKERKEDGD